MGERLACTEEVAGSTPVRSTKYLGLAQSGSASALGAEGRGFESLIRDQLWVSGVNGSTGVSKTFSQGSNPCWPAKYLEENVMFKEVQLVNALKGNVNCLSELVGRHFCKVENIGDYELRFYLTENNYVRMHHEQDCCESVYIEDICGDLEDLVNARIVYFEEVSSEDAQPLSDWEDSYTWTFYRIQTLKGSVDIRWYGTSNGYYSESVDIDFVVE